jgi:hypothetical protein
MPRRIEHLDVGKFAATSVAAVVHLRAGQDGAEALKLQVKPDAAWLRRRVPRHLSGPGRRQASGRRSRSDGGGGGGPCWPCSEETFAGFSARVRRLGVSGFPAVFGGSLTADGVLFGAGWLDREGLVRWLLDAHASPSSKSSGFFLSESSLLW